MKKRKIKKKVKIIFISTISLFIAIIVLVKVISFNNSYQHKLDIVGYSKDEIKTILTFKKNQIEKIIVLDYDENIPALFKTKYFMYEKLNRYLKYYKENSSLDSRDVVEIVNVNGDKKYSDDIKSADVSKGILTLVNKYYALNEKYSPKELVNVGLQYSYSGNKLLKEAYDAYILLYNDAKKLDYNILVSTSYRDYNSLEKTYNKEKNDKGTEEADKNYARPGHSEHQLGLSINVDLYKKEYDEFENTDEYKWLLDNSYKYGFILRYPKDKQNITGYSFEPEHFRYVGIEVAKYIQNNKITFDEYYTYYIEK